MRIRSSIVSLAIPAFLGNVPRAPVSPTDTFVFASFSGAIRGEIPPAPCGISSAAVAPGLGVESFDEVTATGAPQGSGSFEVVVATTCVAPFYQALFSHESLNVRFIFTDAQFHPTWQDLVLANAHLTHVDILVGARDRVPYARVGIAAAAVGVGEPVRDGNAPGRPRAPSIHPATTQRLSIDALGETWSRRGVDSVQVRLSSATPSMDAEFAVTNWHLSVRAPQNAGGVPSSKLQIKLDPLIALDREQTARLKLAADARAELTRAMFAVVNAQGTAGITIRLKGAKLTGNELAQSGQTISLSANQLSVTDIASGRTASTP